MVAAEGGGGDILGDPVGVLLLRIAKGKQLYIRYPEEGQEKYDTYDKIYSKQTLYFYLHV